MVVDVNIMRLIPEKEYKKFSSKVVYGPIISKRSFHSIGINFWPFNKVCTFDCVYCHCGKSSSLAKTKIISIEELKRDLEKGFIFHQKENPFIQDIVIEGNGEPTIYPFFHEATEFLLRLRDKYFPQLPLVLFTNSSNLDKPCVVDSILKYDQVFFKIDAVDDTIAYKLNRNKKPMDEIVSDILRVKKLIETNNYKLKNLEISTAVIGSEQGNVSHLCDTKFIDVLKKLNPQKIYLYDIDRFVPIGKLDFRVKQDAVFNLAECIFSKIGIEIIALQSNKGRGIHELSYINRSTI